MTRPCVCTTCTEPSPLVSTLTTLSTEFAALAEDLDPEKGTRALAIADALLAMARKASLHGDDSLVDIFEVVPAVTLDIQRTLAGCDIDETLDVALVVGEVARVG